MGSAPVKGCFGKSQKRRRRKKNQKEILDMAQQDSDESIEELGIEIDEKYRGTLAFAKSQEGKIFYKRRKNLLFTSRVKKIGDTLNIKDEEMVQIWRFFKKIDTKAVGYINLEQLYHIIQESPSSSSIAFIVDRFFFFNAKRIHR